VRSFHSCRCNQPEIEKLQDDIGREGCKIMCMQPTLYTYIVLHLLKITSIYHVQKFFEHPQDLFDYEEFSI